MMQLIHVMIMDVVVCRFSANFDILSDYQFDDDDDDDEYSDYCIEPSTSRDDMQSLQQDNDYRSLDNADCWTRLTLSYLALLYAIFLTSARSYRLPVVVVLLSVTVWRHSAV